jgi:hypothetical protein
MGGFMADPSLDAEIANPTKGEAKSYLVAYY